MSLNITHGEEAEAPADTTTLQSIFVYEKQVLTDNGHERIILTIFHIFVIVNKYP